MGWLVPYEKLDDQQKDFVDNIDIDSKNVWIKGFPGSGKSILLAYTFRRIVSKRPKPSVVVIVFTHSLIEMFKAAFKEMGLTAEVLTYFQFRKSAKQYDYILCDEVQDLTPTVLREMNRRAQHVIVSGDENQSIFECDPQSREETVNPNDICNLLNAKDFQLNIIHRLSSSIIRAVNKFLPFLDIFKSKRDLTKESVQVRLCKAQNISEEAKYILQESRKAVKVGETAAILIPSKKDIISYVNHFLISEGKPEWQTQLNNYGSPDFASLNSYLIEKGLPIQYVGNGYGSFSENKNMITIMTYHSAKGLDFDHVFIPGLNSNLFISYKESLSKTLFMVAMTRSRKNLYLCYSGHKHSYVDKFSEDCNEIDIHEVLNSSSTVMNNNIFNGNTNSMNIFGGI